MKEIRTGMNILEFRKRFAMVKAGYKINGGNVDVEVYDRYQQRHRTISMSFEVFWVLIKLGGITRGDTNEKYTG